MLQKLLTSATLAACVGMSGCAALLLPSVIYSAVTEDHHKEHPVEEKQHLLKDASWFYVKLNETDTIFAYDLNNDGIIDEAFCARTEQTTELLQHPDGKRWMELMADSIQKNDLEHLVVKGLAEEQQVWPYPKNTRTMTHIERLLLTSRYNARLQLYNHQKDEQK